MLSRTATRLMAVTAFLGVTKASYFMANKATQLTIKHPTPVIKKVIPQQIPFIRNINPQQLMDRLSIKI